MNTFFFALRRPWCWLFGHRYYHITDDIWRCWRCGFVYEGPDELWRDDPWMKGEG